MVLTSSSPKSHLTGVPAAFGALWLCPELFRELLSLPGRSWLPSLLPLLGHPQLWPRRLRAHHPLGLCHGGSQALWEHPRRKEVAQDATTPSLKISPPQGLPAPLSQPINALPPNYHSLSTSTLAPLCKKHKMRGNPQGPFLEASPALPGALFDHGGLSTHSGPDRMKNSWGLLDSKSSEEKKAQKIKGASRKLRIVEVR